MTAAIISDLLEEFAMLRVSVVSPAGRVLVKPLDVGTEVKVFQVAKAASHALGATCKLVHEDNVLAQTATLSECEVKNHAVLTAVASQTTLIFSTGTSFVALRPDGSAITWGDHDCGGDSSTVKAELAEGVVNITGNGFAFAALKNAFAALKTDGSVITWGNHRSGGDSSTVKAELAEGVVNITGNDSAFAALKTDGSVITWGDHDCGGDSSTVKAELAEGVVNITGNDNAFAALKTDGSIVTWGNDHRGGDSSTVKAELAEGVVSIASNGPAFAAWKRDGSPASKRARLSA
eukprot:TRINITY_DN3342_c0_g1_i1.p1 TRINITY_DN3342_c0_g1~~TRINITY_DN3342_c0_g1_i1.p1  ORF type:complete len:292 (+),score=67.16 TRINITY_DN3342_c0_g1_i1:74-949(+)